MPTFKTTENIVIGSGEHFDPNWMDSDKLVLPERENWDYQRELKIEDVNVWEVIAEPWGVGVYASWDPYAEFYLIRYDKDWDNPNVDWQQNVLDGKRNFDYETHYGSGANITIQKRLDELGIKYILQQHWIEPEDMWLYA